MTVKQQVYRQYLQSAAWAQRVQAIRQRSGQRCEYETPDYQRPDRSWTIRCTAESKDVHHLTYERVGQERLEDLIDVCRPHHILLHTDMHCTQCGDFADILEEEFLDEIKQLIQDYESDDMENFRGYGRTCLPCVEMWERDD